MRAVGCNECKFYSCSGNNFPCNDCIDFSHYEKILTVQSDNKYKREIKQGVEVDVYDVLIAWNVTNPAVQHAIKKLLQPGQRGHKDVIQDLEEAMISIGRAVELESNKNEA